MIILVIGPSGVGKSDYGAHVSRAIPGCRFVDLDCALSERWGTPASQMLPEIGDDAFLDRCQQEVCRLMASSAEANTIIAVAAGALQSRRASDWILRHKGPTVAIVSEPGEVYSRGAARNQRRSLEEFAQTEYSVYRKALYNAARFQLCVSGLLVEEARERFVALVRNLTE